MAKKHYMIPAQLLRKLPALRKPSWLLEAFIVRFLASLITTMSLERAADFAGFLFEKLSFVFSLQLGSTCLSGRTGTRPGGRLYAGF